MVVLALFNIGLVFYIKRELEAFERHFEMGSYVLEKDGKIVATAISNRHLTKGKSIGNVFTPKEERGNGYAYNLVYNKIINAQRSVFYVKYRFWNRKNRI